MIGYSIKRYKLSMNIVIFCHPNFLSSQSMPRFANMLKYAYEQRGHTVTIWSPKACVYNWFSSCKYSKWAGYIDQYILFPVWVRKQLKRQSADTLYVFADQALGPWVWLVKNKPHIVHVHDFLALRSALGKVPENPTSWTGRIYQRYIRQGFKHAKHFISVSNKSRDDLHFFGEVSPITSEVVYNGLNYPYLKMPLEEAVLTLLQANLPANSKGMLLHVSGNQWYKNVPGIILMYTQYAQACADPLPLWLVGPYVDKKVQSALDSVPAKGQVLFFYGLNSKTLNAAYSLARAFLFPSHAEGFGWPIIEAQASGCPVITTNEPPMNEVGGNAARYLPRLKAGDDVHAWAKHGAEVLEELLALEDAARTELVAQGLAWAVRFDADTAIESYLRIYKLVLKLESSFNN